MVMSAKLLLISVKSQNPVDNFPFPLIAPCGAVGGFFYFVLKQLFTFKLKFDNIKVALK